MLEISCLKKIYKNKKGKDVLAIDNISLKFPETGMVFLLGKSGSGKSTLLNLIGGLDNPTSGEIIIKGKSSKNFTQADFDSYRNTYVGFIFQEYNILNEFSVFDNIALAIELQNKHVEYEKINDLLKKVDLEDYEKRKPNTLSGGQKQRIAIARALIKNPEIIMADEPTGALDSNTGKQVLDTLKKLSQDRLVIVVSHDREFALEYADRIIELKDGKVISDNIKTNIKSNEISKNINVVGETLVIKNGNNLDNNEFEIIKDFLKNGNQVILSRDKDNVSSFKKIAKINDNNEQEIFQNTNSNNIVLKEYDQNKNIFIKSKLPLKHAIKIGVSGLKNKPFRLLFTIILCSISFLLFGLFSTMTFYNSQNVFKDTLSKYEHDYIRLGKHYSLKQTDYYSDGTNFDYNIDVSTPFYEEDYNSIKRKYGNNVFYGIDNYVGLSIKKTKNIYYSDYFNTIAFMNNDNELYKKITGSYPVKDDEILLSSYIVDSMMYYSVYDANNKSLDIKNRSDILNKEFVFGNKKYRVVGYFDSGEVDSKYEVLKSGNGSYMVENDFYNYLNDSLSLVAFVSENEIKNLLENTTDTEYYIPSILDYTSIVYKLKKDKKMPDYTNSSYISYDDIETDSVIGDELTDKSIYVSPSMFIEAVLNEYADKIYDNSKNEKIYNTAVNIMNGGVYKDNNLVKFTKSELNNEITELYNLVGDSISVDIQLFSTDNNIPFGEVNSYKIGGVITEYSNFTVVVFSSKEYNRLWSIHKENLSYYVESSTNYKVKITPYETIFIPFNKSDNEINNIWNIYSNKNYINDSKEYITCSFISTLSFLDEMVDILSVVFLYAGIFLCVFSLLLLSNFISLSISNKTKEIGILRAVGARSIDVFKIFFSESFVIAFICVVLSIISCTAVCDILNNVLASEIGISVFVFSVVSFVIMVLLAFVTTVVATYIPVRKAANKKPVESIRSL